LVNELVALATEHGILTPYTSFLADETSDVRAVTQNLSRSLRESEMLEESSGRWGFSQRANKLRFQSATQAPAASGYGGSVEYYDAVADRSVAATNIRQIGRKTFFQRGQQWVDSTVSEDDEKSAQKIERYSREFFDLIERHGRHVAKYLAVDEPVVIKLGGQTYEW
jgi:Ca-activated chloride channel family protein